MDSFKVRLRLIMNERGMSQTQLSKLTDIPKSAISQYLSDRFRPRQERIHRLARALNVSPAWLMGVSDCCAEYGEETIMMELSESERQLIDGCRHNPELRRRIRELTTASIFRAAKSEDGTIAPAMKEISAERLKLLEAAPETDEDL